MLACRDLHKSYQRRGGRVDVLRGVDLEIAPGECVVVVGKSGCGKSTLLATLAGMLRPDRGEVRFAGESWQQFSSAKKRDIWNRQIGFVFQSFQLVPYLTAQQNVALAVRGSDRMARSRALLAELEMDHRLGSKPATLSVGEQQRVAIARAVVNSPAVILADEPTGNLDDQTSQEVHRLLGEFRDQGGSLLVVSHRGETAGIADRTFTLTAGRLEAS